MGRGIVIAVALVAVLALAGCAQGPTAAEQKAKCFANESMVETAMSLFKADSGMDAPLQDVLDKTHAVCPSGGKYSYDPATGKVTCSIHGHP
jgi:hypothetical protein